MSIQALIDARVAELGSALRAKVGDDFWLHVTWENGSCSSSRICYSDSLDSAAPIISLARESTIDSALEHAMQAISAIRTYNDECADLGIEPARQQAGAERECTCGAPPDGDGKWGGIHHRDCPALAKSAA